MERWTSLAAYGFGAAFLATALWTTVKSLQSGVARANLQLLHLEEFERSRHRGFFWGVILFNWLVAAGVAALMIFWVA